MAMMEVILNLVDNLSGGIDEAASSIESFATSTESADAAVEGMDPTPLLDVSSAAQEAGLDMQSVGEAAAMSGQSLEQVSSEPLKEVAKGAEEAKGETGEMVPIIGSLKTVMGALIGLGIGAWLMDSVKKAMASKDAWAKFGVVVKEHGGTLTDAKGEVKDLAREHGFLTSEVRESSRLFMQAGMSYQDVTKKHGALEAAMGLSTATGRSLTDSTVQLQRAYMGNGRALKLLGIDINDYKDKSTGLVDQEALNQAILEKTGGQLEEHSKSYEAAMVRMDIATQGLQVAIGTALLPVITPLIEGITWLITGITNLPGPLSTIIVGITALGGAATALYMIFAPIAGVIIPLFEGALASLGGALMGTGTAGTLLGAALGPVGWAILAIIAAVAAGIYIWQTWSKEIIKFKDLLMGGDWAGAAGMIGNSFNYIKNSIWKAMNSAWNYISNFFASLPGKLGNFGSTFLTAGINFAEWLIKGLTSISIGLDKILNDMMAPAAEGGKKGGEKAGKKSGDGLYEGLVKWVTDNGPKMLQLIVTIFDKLLPLLGSVAWKLMGVFGMYLLSGAQQAGANLWSGLSGWLQQLPGRMWQFLLWSILKLVIWQVRMGSEARKAGSKFINGLINYIKTLPARLWAYLVYTAAKIPLFANKARAYATQAGQRIVNGIVDYVKKAPGMVYQELLRIGSRIMSAGGQLYAQARKLGEGIYNNMKKALGIASPGHMYWMVSDELDRIVKVFDDKKSSAAKGASDLGNAIIDGFSNTGNNISTTNVVAQNVVTVKHEVDLTGVPSGNSDKQISDMILTGLEDKQVIDTIDSKLYSTQKRNARGMGAR